MMNASQRPPRVAAIHDLSGFGKCSLTVALPILSAMGVEVSCMPTAVLSTHTGGLTGYTYRDLTEDMRPVFDHWMSLQIPFEAVYTGFLGSFEQLDIVGGMLREMGARGALRVVDPVMADNGKLYGVYTPAMAEGMAKMCAQADIITPNLTEAAFMLGEDYREPPYDEGYILEICKKLTGLGPKKIVLTGVCYDDERLGAGCYDANDGSLCVHLTPRVPGSYHGTGDVYTSTLLGALMNGQSLSGATRMAAQFTYECILRTHKQGTDNRYGVDFERGLGELAGRV